MQLLHRLWARPERVVAGLMSGTSLDGVDAVLARLSGSGRALRYEVLTHVHVAFPDELVEALLRNSAPETSSVRELSGLGVVLAHRYAEAVERALESVGLGLGALDLVGSHGQTVHHVPVPEAVGGVEVASTLQIGDGSTLAALLGVPVVSDFRPADLALGGQGAPLVPYFDYVCCADEHETRALLNLGGIANLTVLPASRGPASVRAFDTGPANMVLDALARRLFDRPMDVDGELSARGTAHPALLDALLAHPYFDREPPKSTGREDFGEPFVDDLLARADALGVDDPHDRMATALALTVRSVHDACRRFADDAPDVVIVAGGGRHNPSMMRALGEAFAPVPVRPSDDYGVEASVKEALCFAILAHETINGVPTNLPSVTGASGPALLGKLCVPFARRG